MPRAAISVPRFKTCTFTPASNMSAAAVIALTGFIRADSLISILIGLVILPAPVERELTGVPIRYRNLGARLLAARAATRSSINKNAGGPSVP